MTWKKLLATALALLCAYSVYRWVAAEHYQNYPPLAQGPWVAFGDSLTEGFGASEGKDYPNVLSQTLGFPIQNFGHAGETSKEGLNRVEEIAALHPRVVLLCFGGNDALNGLPSTQLFGNIEAMIDRLHREGSFVVLIGIRSASLRDRFEKPFKELARRKEVVYVADFLKGLAFKPVYMSDAVHPNDDGYKQFVLRLEKELKPFLSELKPNRPTAELPGDAASVGK
ncbi:MAG: putative lipase, GDSL-type [Verrucomicrobiales bacterium]|nr:putative lipase, GDSL-type [Verrucomicrobiales bacterium]